MTVKKVRASFERVALAACSLLVVGLAFAQEERLGSPLRLPATLPNPSPPVVSQASLRARAEAITVKVLAGQSWGSGILIGVQDGNYTVVTNYHVLNAGQQDQSYRVETPDGQVHAAKVTQAVDFDRYDLGLLQFHSDRDYPVIALSPSSQAILSEKVYAAGFPFEADASHKRGFAFTEGKVELISTLSFRGGYQIGYTNTIKKGMSGGPLLNARGEVIGINGRHKYPLWGNPYVFEDGTAASVEQKEQMSQLSWAIPIQTFLHFAPQFAHERPKLTEPGG